LLQALFVDRTPAASLKWLGHALERSPYEGSAHLALARLLAANGARQQALIHVRYASLYDVNLRDRALAEASRWAKTPDDLQAAFPRGLPGNELLGQLCRLLTGSLRVDCSREMAARAGTDESRRALASDLLDAWETTATPCAAERVPACASELATLLAQLHADDPKSDWPAGILRARQLMLDGKPREATELLLRRCPTSSESAPCWERALTLAAATHDVGLLSQVGERYAASHCAAPSSCAAAHDALATTFSSLQAWGSALAQLNLAIREDPSVDRWLGTAELALHAGAAHSAALALGRAQHSGSLTETQQARFDKLHAQLLDDN
jgi:hypothetical protein